MGYVDLLDMLRAFGKSRIYTDEDFVQLWMNYGNTQVRLEVFYELDEWSTQYKYKGIYDFICQLIKLWDLVQGYERDHPPFKTLEEADEHFNNFIIYRHNNHFKYLKYYRDKMEEYN